MPPFLPTSPVFTPLTEALRRALGPRQGSEALSNQLNRTYNALMAEVDAYRGSVIGFAGDAITCWFDNADGPAVPRAAACAIGLQRTMAAGASITLPGGGITTLALKVAIACGSARRMVVGDPDVQTLDLLAGATLARVAAAEHHAVAGEVVLDAASVAALGATAVTGAWREDAELGERFAPLLELLTAPPTAPWPALPTGLLSIPVLRPWLLPAVYTRELAGQGLFLTELRPAVAMFVRFVGIDYDNEPDAETRLDAFISAVQRVLTRYDGTLLQVIIGDKGSYLCCAFGAPVAYEDNAHRAVLAALALHDEAGAASALPPLQIGLSQGVMRCGAYGGTSRRTYGILGDEVNLAARLMGFAAPGETMVSTSVQASVADKLTIEPRPPVQLKGKSGLQPVFLIKGVRPVRAVRLPEPDYALPMVGRDAELAQSDQVLSQTLTGHGQILGITAEAGLGKSRLVAEIVRLAQQRGMVGYGGACQSTGTRSPYLVWQPIWRALFALDPSAALTRQSRDLAALVAEWAPERVAATPLLGPLLGLALPANDFTQSLEPKDRQGALHALLRDCLVAVARAAQRTGSGVLIVLEDVHWIDAASTELLQELAHGIAGLPVLLVLAYRPSDLAQPYGRPLEGLPNSTEISLGVLAGAAVAQMIQLKLLQLFPTRAGDLSAALVAQLMERAQGNPFYLEELLNYLHDQGIDPRETGTLVGLELPDSLHRLILSRIDRLSGQQQVILKASSVIGRRFLVGWLYGAFPLLAPPDGFTLDLTQLAHLDLVPLDTPEPELAYLFKHVVTREVAYESLGASTRATLHDQMAAYLEQTATTTEQLLDILAYHYDQSDNLPKKREYLRRAGLAAAARFANAAAHAYLSRALELAPPDDWAEQYTLLLARETIHEVLGERSLEAADLDRLEALVERLADPPRRAEVALHRGRYAERIGNYPAAISAAQSAVTWAETAGLTGLAATARQRWGWALLHQHDYAGARTQLEQSLQLARAAGDQRRVCQTLTDLGTLAVHQGAHAEAREWYTQSLHLARALGDRRQEGHALGNLGTLLAEQGDLPGARLALEQTLASAEAIGDRQVAGTTRSNLGFLCILLGDYPGARQFLAASLAQLREVGDRRVEATSLGNLGMVAVHQGAYAEAHAAYTACLALAEAIGDPMQVGWAHRGLGSVALGQGDLAAAEAAYQQSLATLQAVGTPALVAEPLAGLVLVALARGDAAAARGPAETILAHLTTGTLDGAEEPMVVYLACYQALRANADSRAPALLARAHAELQARAAQLTDVTARQMLLEQVPAHRGLLAAMAESR